MTLDDLVELVSLSGTDSLDRLSHSVELAGRLTDLSDHVVGYFVDEARADGASWADIGGRLGVTRQAAQKRFVFTDRPAGQKRERMFGRFSAPARETVHQAVSIAQEAGSDHIGTEHILLAILRDEEDIATRAIVSLGSWSGDRVRSSTTAMLEGGHARRHGRIPFAADAKKVLQLALRETLRSGQRQIGNEHLLLGMLRDHRSTAASLLAEEEIDLKKVELWLAAA